MTPKYTATTQLLVNQKNENNANGQAYNNQQADIQVINTYKDIITSPVILKEPKKNWPTQLRSFARPSQPSTRRWPMGPSGWSARPNQRR
jgi:Capsular polysaccharide biosynthesis protein